jgi:hypothetical protein
LLNHLSAKWLVRADVKGAFFVCDAGNNMLKHRDADARCVGAGRPFCLAIFGAPSPSGKPFIFF